jgi:hypothetical protein
VPSHISFNSLPFSGEAEDAQSSASFFLVRPAGRTCFWVNGGGLPPNKPGASTAVKIPDSLERRKC